MCQHMSQTVIFQPEKFKVRLHLVAMCKCSGIPRFRHSADVEFNQRVLCAWAT
jgi:hypothetical protein